MLRTRIIPSLLMQNGRLVKTRKFKNPAYIGDPINTLKIFNVKEVDEIILLDISASKENKSPDFDYVAEIASECFMPICYGGGVRSIDDASRLFESGIEKISLQNAALTNLGLVEKIANKYGSSSVVASIDVKKNWSGKKKLYSSSTGKTLAASWQKHSQDCVNSGAGEVLVNLVDRDGELCGLDTETISEMADLVSVPVIASGGTKSVENMMDGVRAGASAIAAGALFVYQGPHRAVLISYPKYETLEMHFKTLNL